MARRFGDMVRAARKSLKLTLDDVQFRTRISKPYLSQIETGHAPPPEDAKVLQLERDLGFSPGQLLRAAHLERTPADIRVYIEQLRTENDTLREKRLMGRQMARFHEAGRQDAEGEGRDDLLTAESLGQLIPLLGKRHRLGVEGFSSQILDFPAAAAEEYIRCPGVGGNGAFAVELQGEFMAEVYRNGDVIIFGEAARLTSGRDHLVCIGGKTCHFRRAFADGDASVRLQPINPAHPATTVARASITSLHSVLAIIRVVS